jgi:superfamily I DNA/RNA helicase
MLVPENTARNVRVLTLHAFCSFCLRRYSEGNDFTIYDESDSRKIIKAIMAERGIEISDFSPAKILDAISTLKRAGVDARAAGSVRIRFVLEALGSRFYLVATQTTHVHKICISYSSLFCNALILTRTLTLTFYCTLPFHFFCVFQWGRCHVANCRTTAGQLPNGIAAEWSKGL